MGLQREGGASFQRKTNEKRLVIGGRRFCLTLHGATEDQFQKITKFFDSSEVDLAIVAWETGEHSIHPHFQCYFEMKEKCRLKNRLRDEILNSENFHLENARGTKNHNVNYVYAMDKPYEIGLIRYSKGDYEIPIEYDSTASEWTRNFKPRLFQKKILEIIKTKTNDRDIHWFWEPKGEVGKTSICKYLHRMYGAVYISGRSEDIKYALIRYREVANRDPKIVVLDLTRVDYETNELARIVESIKNGIFFSGKYDSMMVDMKSPPHLFLLSNKQPNLNFHSSDRWNVYEIDSSTYDYKQIMKRGKLITKESPNFDITENYFKEEKVSKKKKK